MSNSQHGLKDDFNQTNTDEEPFNWFMVILLAVALGYFSLWYTSRQQNHLGIREKPKSQERKDDSAQPELQNNPSKNSNQEEIKESASSAPKSKSSLKEERNSETSDKPLGCVLGAFVGNGVGIILKNSYSSNDNEQNINKAMEMMLNANQLARGQIENEFEINLSLMSALINQQTLNLDKIIRNFGQWFHETKPDYMSLAQEKVLKTIDLAKIDTDFQYSQAKELNQMSETNQCLMRLTPFAVWAHKLSPDELFEAVRLQTSLTHTNEVTIHACYLYCYAIKLILSGMQESTIVYNETLKEAQRQSKLSGCSSIQFWMENQIDLDDLSEMPDPNFRPISFIKIAFCWAFYYLKKNFSYELAIRDIISRGGDTSMNAAIVGGLIGALHGKNSIPQTLREAIMNFDPANVPGDQKQQRPKMLYPGVGFEKEINQLYNSAPEKLVVEWGSDKLSDIQTIKDKIESAINY